MNYVAGLGRGATGFTTRSDIGPARTDEGKKEDAKLNDSKYDEFSGYQGSLVDEMPYDEDDEAADLVWNEIDARMDERRKSRREQRIAEQLTKYRSVRPKLQHQFTDLKRDLQHVSEEQWNELPEPGEHRKHSAAEKRNERYIPAPDTLLEPALHDLAKYNAAKLASMCVNLGVGFGDASRARCLRFARDGMFGSGADYSWGTSTPGAGAPPLYCT